MGWNMLKQNQEKYVQACQALKALGLEPRDFIDLNMVACLDTWSEAFDVSNITPEEIVELEAEYHLERCAKALAMFKEH